MAGSLAARLRVPREILHLLTVAAAAERQVLELSTHVHATGPASALATAEVALVAAAMKADIRVDVTVANVWLDDRNEALNEVPRRAGRQLGIRERRAVRHIAPRFPSRYS